MPKYYCDYCDIFLTHDAPRVIKDHSAGWKHCAAVRAHYLNSNMEAMALNIGEVIKDYEERKELVPVPAPISSKQRRMPMPPPPGMMMPPGMMLPPGMTLPLGMTMPPGMFPPGMHPGMMMNQMHQQQQQSFNNSYADKNK